MTNRKSNAIWGEEGGGVSYPRVYFQRIATFLWVKSRCILNDWLLRYEYRQRKAKHEPTTYNLVSSSPKTQAPDNNPQRTATYNMAPGTVVRLRNHTFVLVDALKGPHRWIHAKTGHNLSHEQFAARIHKNTTNLPVILFDPLDTNTNTDTNTDKENNND